MHAIMYSRFGGPEVLELADIPTPEHGRQQLVVRVVTAGVNPLDWKLMAGAMRPLRGRRKARLVGCDFAGYIESVGSGVTGWATGDEVFGSVGNPLTGARGALAEFVVVSPGEVARKPANVSFALAAALPIAGASALHCFQLARLHAGAEVLVVGASGGVGSTVVPMATADGARITGVCRSENGDYVRDLGAHRVIAYDRNDLLADRAKFDAIIDTVGLHPVVRLRSKLRPGGAMAVTMPGFPHVVAAIWSRLTRRRPVRNLMLRMKRTHLEELARRAANGQLAPIAITCFGFDNVRTAFDQSRSGHTRGKLVVEVDGERRGSREAVGR